MKRRIIIEMNNCSECPFLRSNRYYYCSKKYKDDVEAYKNGGEAEYTSELKGMFDRCKFSEEAR